jgi:hypothetical protein
VQKRARPPRIAGQQGNLSHEFSQEIAFYVEGGRYAGFNCTVIPVPTGAGAFFSFSVTGILVSAQ